jgi:hypothetical protein
VDPVPEPLLLRKSGRAGNRTRDLWIGSPLDHRGGLIFNIVHSFFTLGFSPIIKRGTDAWLVSPYPPFRLKVCLQKCPVVWAARDVAPTCCKMDTDYDPNETERIWITGIKGRGRLGGLAPVQTNHNHATFPLIPHSTSPTYHNNFL